jgi:hypothetical protein
VEPTLTATMNKTVMPGGGIARRPLHVIIMADCPGSMPGCRTDREEAP